MRVAEFDFHLPESSIALAPVEPRDSSRLLVLRRETGGLEHRRFSDLPEYIGKGDLLLLNKTRVFPARLVCRKPSGGRLDILLVKETGPGVWEILSRGRYSGRIDAGSGLAGEVKDGRVVRFDLAGEALREILHKDGLMPLPPYIKREPGESDRRWYQTAYAEEEGSIAAPTAGLHFTPGLLDIIRRKDVLVRFLTLHVGVGTFRPVTAELVGEHNMESERFEIGPDLSATIREVKESGGKVITVGTTTTRAIEGYLSGRWSAGQGHGTGQYIRGTTDIFIHPGYTFRAADGLVTNFHLPRSTPLMLAAAFSGRENLIRAYGSAIEAGYRFFSYGDAMLIL